jgi:hypothetical protein
MVDGTQRATAGGPTGFSSSVLGLEMLTGIEQELPHGFRCGQMSRGNARPFCFLPDQR